MEPYIKRVRVGKGGRMCGMKASLLLGGGWRNEIDRGREGGMPERGGGKENVGLVGKPASGSGNLKTGDRQVGSLAR